MELYDAILYRKSTREFSLKKVKQPMIEEIRNICKDITYLNNELSINANVVDRGHIIHFLMGKDCKVKAPHYIVVTSDKGTDYLENIGFAIEEVVLKLTSLGIGTCWLESKLKSEDLKEITEKEGKNNQEFTDLDFLEDVDEREEEPCVIIAFGYPKVGEELFRRKGSRPERKSNKDITRGFDLIDEWEEIFDITRMSPSINNIQPWYFYRQDNSVFLYEKKQKKQCEKMSRVSVGSALRHFDIACKYFNKDMSYGKSNYKKLRGKNYYITIIENTIE